MASGWHRESRRHALAAKGIKTAVAPTNRAMEMKKAVVPETISIRDVKIANERAGNYWFTPESMKFFNSKIEGIAYLKPGSKTEGYFISSEKHTNAYAGINEPRKYTIRKFNLKTGEVETEGEFQAYGTKAQATTQLKKLLGSGKVMSGNTSLRYRGSSQYRNAKEEDIKQFLGMKNDTFTIDQHDAKMIVANLKKSEYDKFKEQFKNNNYASFRVLQDIVYHRLQ